ncbi:MAG: helix-turn-helix domain-containing protein [Oscillospiraceae bacterium]
MSLEELRERNKSLVTEKALELFIKNGIDNTKVKDIAKSAGLTERSAYRYFDTKTDLVQAAAYLFWNKTLEEIRGRVEASRISEFSGIEQIRALLYQYSNLYFENKQGVLFTLDAEMYLFSAGRSKTLNRPPEKFDTSESPLVLAIRKGLKDGSVSRDVNVKELYYNSYDSILGVMQKLALEASGFTELDNKQRMKHLCDLFVRAFQGD